MDKPADEEESTAATGPAIIRDRRDTIPGTSALGFWFWLFGIILPAITLLIELVTHCCAEAVFDPIPTIWHTALISLVPLANFLIYRDTLRTEPRVPRWLAILSGSAIAVSLYYTILFGPVTPFAALGILWFGLGLLPLASLFSFIAILRAVRKISIDAQPQKILQPVMIGLALGSVALAVLELPRYVTRVTLHRASAGDPDSRGSAIQQLRSFGSRDILLRACYEPWRRNLGSLDTTGWLASYTGLNSVPTDSARRVYFEVTGKAFNSVEPPALRSRGNLNFFDQFSFDDGQGGDAVGVRLAHLHLENSRIDTHIDPASALSYTEWTLVFKNQARNQAEARFQTLLPPAGVVSRLTLWVNGEPQEAAFAATAKVKAAYKNVVQVQRRDPVLVTSTGPDRVLVQCFPVPPGGEIKIRLGITSPLQPDLNDASRATNWMPRIIERNFNIAKLFRHALWVQSPEPLATAIPGLDSEIADGEEGHALTGTLSHEVYNAPSTSITATGLRPGTAVWTEDPFKPGTAIVRQAATEENRPHEHLVIVLDTSTGMAPDWDNVKSSILSFVQKHTATLVLAGDDPSVHEGASEITSALFKLKATGGKDNATALLKALGKARGIPDSAVVWVHAAQPFLLADAGLLEQTLERSFSSRPIYSFATEQGPDLVTASLHQHTDLRSATRGIELDAFLAQLTTVVESSTHRYTRQAMETPIPTGAEKVWDHLARYWAFTETMQQYRDSRRDEKNTIAPAAAALAAEYQLVTPFSGAVVLETKRDFEAAGLDQLDPSSTPSIPSIPEPGSTSLILLALASMLLRRTR